MRGYPGAMGYDRRPHPDNKEGSKYVLIVDGIRKIKRDLAPGMDFCYVWLDYGCMDQDGDPYIKFKQLDKIVQACDCLFTPIHDPDWESWAFPNGLIKNIYEDYQAKLWNVGDFAYVNRAWCRVEMFYASNIPLLENSASRVDNLRAGLKLHITNGVRPHMLYGDREVNRNIQPIILPPLQNSYYDRLDPKKGKLSVASDVVLIEQLIEELEPYKKIQKEGYEGEYRDGLKHGRGVFRYANGDVYEGEFKDGRLNGRGVMNYASGSVYDGQYDDDKRNGFGVYTFANGNVYEGEWKGNKKHGRGTMRYANGDVFEGAFMDNNRNGSGVFRYANGDVYEGEYSDNFRHGRGIFKYANGDVYDGQWENNKKMT